MNFSKILHSSAKNVSKEHSLKKMHATLACKVVRFARKCPNVSNVMKILFCSIITVLRNASMMNFSVFNKCLFSKRLNKLKMLKMLRFDFL